MDFIKINTQLDHMSAEECGLECKAPEFIDSHDHEAVRKEFLYAGIVLVENCEEQSLIQLAQHLGEPVQPRNETTSGTCVSNIRCAPGLEGKGYSSEELFFHTDRSGWSHPPKILTTAMKTASGDGGHSLFADGRSMITYLREHEPELYEIVTSAKHSSFKAEDGKFVPRPIFDTATGILRLRLDDGIQLSAALTDAFPTLRNAIYKYAFSVSLAEGQGYVLDNHRFLHGRTAFSGAREVLRILAFEGQGREEDLGEDGAQQGIAGSPLLEVATEDEDINPEIGLNSMQTR
ncbi:hypothetical protein F5Y16DRAFT_394502 [Xylariaceae sp. FL0255]|nr:hypothetical protein F5Y16DRAFT_394502 [Xylariaceae sp. FL0255]